MACSTDRKTKLVILTTHPIQYNAPLFKILAKSDKLDIEVFYTWGESVLNNKYDTGFKRVVNWDIDLLDGYCCRFLKNISRKPGSDHFFGIINPAIIKEIESTSPDLLLVYGWNFFSHLKVLYHFKKRIPIYFRGDSTLLDKQPFLRGKMRLLLLRSIYRYVDYAFYVGKNNYDYYHAVGLKNTQLIYAPHAVDNERFNTSETNVNNGIRLRAEYSISENAVVFLFAGKLESKKDPEIVLRAFDELQHKEAFLIIVGEGELEENLKKRYSRCRNIKFIGFQNQMAMPSVLNMANVVVLPSRGPGETWGLILNEAMACGNAVIASDMCGGARDLIHGGINGYIFKAGDVNQLTHFMEVLLADKKKINDMQLASKEIIKRFSLEATAIAIENQSKLLRP